MTYSRLFLGLQIPLVATTELRKNERNILSAVIIFTVKVSSELLSE